MTSRVLIVVLDALRPEFVTPALMPALSSFAQAGCRFADHHSVFPTETRVNQSSVVTGCYPARHGIVANQFPLGGGVLNTGKDEDLEAALADMDAPLLERPALADIVAAAGGRYASISAGTSGGGRLINLSAEATGQFRLALRRPGAAVPDGVAERIAARIGPIPEYTRPAVAWNRYAARAWLDWVEPEIAPDVSLLWLCEPDESFHWHGIGSPEALEAIRGVDAVLGEILAAKAAEIAAGTLHVIAMSDHGQISLAGGKLDLAARMRAAGLAASDGMDPAADYTVVVHSAGGIWVRDSDPGLIADAAAWLSDAPWCGPLFTREDLPGTLPIEALMAAHARAPDIYLALAHDGRDNAWGLPGTSADNAPYPAFGGAHGGLSRHELHNVLAIGGARVAGGRVVATPSGNVDILPTALTLAGMAVPGGLDGRVLAEAFGDTRVPAPTAHDLVSGRSRLRTISHGGTRYLHRGWTEPPS